jgi:hypothetical protein
VPLQSLQLRTDGHGMPCPYEFKDGHDESCPYI